MTNEFRSFREILRSEFQNRLAKNPHYRLMDFAKELATPISRMSEIMSGRSGLSVKRALHYSEVLQFDHHLKTTFLDMVHRECSRSKWHKNTEDSLSSQKPAFTCKVPLDPAKKEAFLSSLQEHLQLWQQQNGNAQDSGAFISVEAFLKFESK